MDETAFAQDLSNSRKKKLDLQQCMRHALANADKSYASQFSDIARLSFGDGGLAAQDYYYFGLYDDEAFSFDEKKRFMSDRIFHKVILRCCDSHWWAAADDKFLAYTLLAGYGAPIPETQAVFIDSQRNFGSVRKLASEAELDGFLKTEAQYPLFAKPMEGVGSFGAYLIEGHWGTDIQLSGGETVSLSDFVKRLDTDQGYLLQSVLRPHPDLTKFSETVSTVRVIVIIEQGRPRILHTIWKVPARGAIADNFWRKGNMLGAVNTETGVVERVVTGVGPWLEEISDHPGTGARMVGATLPNWRELIDLCLDSAGIFNSIRYQSWDIALCPDGPVIVEVNTGSAFNLSQLSKGEGFLTDRFGAFLTECGYRLKTRH